MKSTETQKVFFKKNKPNKTKTVYAAKHKGQAHQASSSHVRSYNKGTEVVVAFPKSCRFP